MKEQQELAGELEDRESVRVLTDAERQEQEEAQGEAAWEQHCSNFYGGSTPFTDQEKCDAAAKEPGQ